jgi:hypothetical protein
VTDLLLVWSHVAAVDALHRGLQVQTTADGAVNLVQDFSACTGQAYRLTFDLGIVSSNLRDCAISVRTISNGESL